MQTMRYKNLAKLLRQHGYIKQRGRGSHQIYVNASGKTVILPIHSGDINPCLVAKIKRDIAKNNGGQ